MVSLGCGRAKASAILITALLLSVASLVIVVSPPSVRVVEASPDTFGYTTAGTLGSQSTHDRISGSVFTCPSSGTVTSMSAYVVVTSDGEIVNCKMAIFRHSDGVKIGETEEWFEYSNYTGWITRNIVGTVNVSGGVEYVLAAWGSAEMYPYDDISVKYDDGEGTTQGHYKSLTYGAWPSAITDFTHEDRKYSIYVTFSPPPGPTQPQLYSPLDGAITSDNTPSFEWTCGTDADNHRILIDNDSDFSTPTENVLLGATDNTYSVTTSLSLDNYSWKVIAINAQGENASDSRTFEIILGGWLTPMSVHSKCGENVGTEASKAIDDNLSSYWWHDVTGCYHWIILDLGISADIEEIRIYVQYFWKPWGATQGFTVYVSENTTTWGDNVWEGSIYGGTGWRETAIFPEKNGRYVKLVSRDNISAQFMNEVDIGVGEKSMRVGTPGTPILFRPVDRQYTTDNTPYFEWTEGMNADNHRLLVDDDNDFSSPNENRLFTTENNFTIAIENALPDERKYYWKIIAARGSNETSSNVWSFFVSSFPSIWSIRENNPVVSAEDWHGKASDAVCLIRDNDGTIYLYFEGYNPGQPEQVGLLYSTDDGQTWSWHENGNPLSDWGANTDEAAPAPIRMDNGTIYMVNTYEVGGVGGWRVCIAEGTSWDNFHQRTDLNPIIDIGSGDNWDARNVYHASAPVLRNNTWYIFYTGVDASWNRAVGYATTSAAKFPAGPNAPTDNKWEKQTVNAPLFEGALIGIIQVGSDNYYMRYTDEENSRFLARNSADLISWGEPENLGLYFENGSLADGDSLKTENHGWIYAVTARYSGENWQIYIFEENNCPFKPTLSSPENDLTIGKKIVFEWTAPPKAWLMPKNRLLVDNDSNFSSPAENVLFEAGVDNWETTLLDGFYYWKIISISEDDKYENESDVWQFTVHSAPSIKNTYTQDSDNAPASTLNVDEWYRFLAEIEDLDTLADVQSVELRLYENTLEENAPDNARDHYTFKWLRGETEWIITENIGSGGYCDIALDSQGNPHVASHWNDIVKHIWLENGTWYSEDVGSGYYGGVDIAVDNANNVYVCWNTSTSENLLKFRKKTGGSWGAIENVDNSLYYLEIGMALENNQYPHIAYRGRGGGMIKHAKNYGSGWITENVGYCGMYPVSLDMALDDNNYPHIAYPKYVSSDTTYLSCDRWDGSQWINENVDTIGHHYTGSDGISIDLENGFYPHISYVYDDGGNDARLKYAHKTQSGWSVEIVDNNGDTGYWSSLKLDSNNQPNIAYSGGFGENFAIKISGSWTFENIDDDAGATGIAIDSNDTPKVVYWATTYLFYAERTTGGWSSPSGYLLTNNCVAGNDSLTTDNYVFVVKLSKIASPTNWDVWVKVVDNSNAQDNEEYLNKFSVTAYLEVSIDDTTLAFTGSPNQSDVTPSQQPSIATVTANVDFNIRVKLSGDWVGQTHGKTISASNTQAAQTSGHSGEINLSISYQILWTDIGWGESVQRSIYWFLDVPDALLPDTYTATFYMDAVQYV